MRHIRLKNGPQGYCIYAIAIFAAAALPSPLPSGRTAASEVRTAGSVIRNLEQAQLHYDRGEFPAALAETEAGLAINSLYIPLWLLKGRILADMGNFAAADEAVSVVLSADNDNPEIALLALRVYLGWPDLSDSDRNSRLTSLADAVGDKVFSDALGRGVLNRPDFAVDMAKIIAVLGEGKGSRPAAEILRRYGEGAFADAAALFADAKADAADKDFGGALSFIVGRALSADALPDEALAMLRRAKTNGYDAAEADNHIGTILLAQGKPLDAAAAWEASWRLSANPGRTSVKIIDAYISGKNPAKAMEIFDAASAAFPAHPGLQARKLFLLEALRQTRELTKYAVRLSGEGYGVGVAYGQYLIALRNRDYKAAATELKAARDAIENTTGLSLGIGEVEFWLDSGGGVDTIADPSSGTNFVTAGRELWDRGKIVDSLIVWEEALRLGGVRTPRIFVLGVTDDLLASNHPRQAAAFFRRQMPGMSEIDLLVALVKRNRWSSVDTLIANMPDSETIGTSWPALFKTISATRGGETEKVVEALKEFSESSEEAKELFIWDIDADGLLARQKLTPESFRGLVSELGDRIIQDGHSGGYRYMLASPYWRSGSGMDSAVRALMRTGQTDAARQFLEVALEGDPGNSRANFYMGLLHQRAGRRLEAKKYVAAGMRNADGAIREGLLALDARLNDDREGEISHLTLFLELEPDDHDIRLELIRSLRASHRYIEADAARDYLVSKSRRAPLDVASHLALAHVELGEYDKAEPLWRRLTRRFPQSARPLAGLGTTLNLKGEPEKTVELLSPMAEKTGDAELAALIAEALLTTGDAQEALRWVDAGLAGASEDLRLLSLGVSACEALEDHCGVIGYAERYLALNTTSSPIHTMYGAALVQLKMWDKVYNHNIALLRTNSCNMGAMEREFERLSACGKPGEIWEIDRAIAAAYGNEPAQILRSAVSAAGAGEFRYSLNTLECIMDYGPNSAALTFYFTRVGQDGERFLGATPVGDVAALLDMMRVAYRHAGTEALIPGINPERDYLLKIPLVLLVGRSTPAALAELDRHLESVGGRACLVIGEESLSQKTPIWADVDFLRTLAATGRWEFILTDYHTVRFPGPREAETTSFWTQKKWLDTRYETIEEMRSRVTAEIARLKNKALEAGIDVKGWVHPDWGDYGQRVIVGTQQEAMAYRQAVSCSFPMAFTQTTDGFSIPGGDCLRIPMRVVGPGTDACELLERLQYRHTTRRAVLELAKAKSWHDQFPAADVLFDKAREYGLENREISYFQGRNSYYQGDVPYAIFYAHEALNEDPVAERTLDLMNDAYRLKRPLLTVEPRYWHDSEDEKYGEIVANFSFHVTNCLELRVLAGVRRWENDDGKLTGAVAGVGAKYYFHPGNYLYGELRSVSVNRGGHDYLEGTARWHGIFNLSPFNYKVNGTFDLEYHHEGIETRKAQLGNIRANRFVANTSTRINNWWDLDLNAYYTSRTDGNDTVGMLFRPTYRIKDIPQLRVGYWFAAADSDRNPDEYYAPVDYLAHQAVVMYRHRVTEKFSLTGLGSFGYARTRGNGWRRVFRANAGFNWNINECVQLSGAYQYLKLPDYSLHQYSVLFGYRF